MAKFGLMFGLGGLLMGKSLKHLPVFQFTFLLGGTR